MSDEFGDRMKMYEGVEASRKLMPLLPIVARLDGRSFSRFTANLRRPYDSRLSDLMVKTTAHLVSECGALIGYTQSDEISLIINQADFKSNVWFDGKIQKIVSNLASQASAFFNIHLAAAIPEKVKSDVDRAMPTFDCRVWNVPNREEAVNALLWREQDATKNSVSMATRFYYSHKDMNNKDRAEMMDMLHKKGVNWNDYPAFFKRGTYVRRVYKSGKFTKEEIEKLPPKHAARFDSNLMVDRSVVEPIDLPPLGKIVNRVAMIFENAKPVTAEELANKCVCIGLEHRYDCHKWELPY